MAKKKDSIAKPKKEPIKKKAPAKKKTSEKDPAGKFEKGHEKKGGRKKGTPNKVTNKVKMSLAEAMAGHIENLPAIIDKIKFPEDKVTAIAKVLPYILPRLNTVDLKVEDPNKGPRTIIIQPVKPVKSKA